jgi:hypothetical protein
MTERFRTFSAFWPHYLREHAQPRTRTLHYVGTSLTVIVLIAAALTASSSMLWLVPLLGYGFAWGAHAFVERNKPATFTYPLWSLAADFRMWGLWLTGRLEPHLRDAGLHR